MDLPEIEYLSSRGYEIERVTHYQFRVESVFDMFPRRKRCFNLANKVWGYYPDNLVKLVKFVDEQVAIADKILDEAIAAGRIQDEDEPVVQGRREYRESDDHRAAFWTRPKFKKAGA